ncbi:MAG TPA: plastocyanin/azurin family copper-binding protein [Candidatus Nanoarchaeia archaeon]|nr:plastocyanin/azurin family copper-binding protein [Candidatus Nanoarchaeia archaeon]
MGKLLLASIILVLAILAGIYFISNNAPSVTGKVIADNPETNLKTFIVDSSHLRFFINGIENPDIKVKKGDKIRIEFTSSEGFHDWKLDEFNAATAKINAGGSSSVEFIADKTGTFEYYCSVGQHRANGMKGKLIVE